MGLLARKADGVSLDAESAEHHPERKVHPLQNGTLLDVQLEVGDGVLELPPRLVGPVHETQSHGTLLGGEGAHDFEGANHVQGTVEPASVRDGVYVSAEDDGLLRVTGCRGPDVAGLIGLYLGYLFNLLQFAPEPLTGFAPLPCPRDAA